MSTTTKTMPNCRARSGLSFPLLKLKIFPDGDPQWLSLHLPTGSLRDSLGGKNVGALRAPRTYTFSLQKEEPKNVQRKIVKLLGFGL